MKRISDTSKSFLAAFLSLAIIGAAGAIIAINKGFERRLPQNILNIVSAQTDINPRRDECHERDVASLKASGGCMVLEEDEAKNYPVRYLSFGDSFSNTLMPALEELSRKYKINGIQTSFSSCPPVIGIERFKSLEGDYRYPCREFNDTVLGIIKQRNIRNVILFARWSAYTHEYVISDAPTPPRDMAQSIGIFEKNLLGTIEMFEKMGVRVWVLKQPPEYPFNVPQVLSKARMFSSGSSVPRISYQIYEERQALVNSIFKKAEDAHPFTRFIDVAGILCPQPEATCLMEKDGYSLYRDSNHLSVRGIMYTSPLLDGMFKTMSERT